MFTQTPSRLPLVNYGNAGEQTSTSFETLARLFKPRLSWLDLLLHSTSQIYMYKIFANCYYYM